MLRADVGWLCGRGDSAERAGRGGDRRSRRYHGPRESSVDNERQVLYPIRCMRRRPRRLVKGMSPDIKRRDLRLGFPPHVKRVQRAQDKALGFETLPGVMGHTQHGGAAVEGPGHDARVRRPAVAGRRRQGALAAPIFADAGWAAIHRSPISGQGGGTSRADGVSLHRAARCVRTVIRVHCV
jgi:hypothetical protein